MPVIKIETYVFLSHAHSSPWPLPRLLLWEINSFTVFFSSESTSSWLWKQSSVHLDTENFIGIYLDWTSSRKFLGIYQAESRSEAHPSSLLHDMMFRLIYNAISALSHQAIINPSHSLLVPTFADVRAKSAAMTSFCAEYKKVPTRITRTQTTRRHTTRRHTVHHHPIQKKNLVSAI